jgi:hypothetical protein
MFEQAIDLHLTAVQLHAEKQIALLVTQRFVHERPRRRR